MECYPLFDSTRKLNHYKYGVFLEITILIASYYNTYGHVLHACTLIVESNHGLETATKKQ